MNRLCFVILSVIAFTMFACFASAEQLNGGRGDALSAPQALLAQTCEIDDNWGTNPVTSVHTTYLTDYVYFAQLWPNAVVYRVKFAIKLPNTCPNNKQIFKFYIASGYEHGWLTPFAIVDWGGDVCIGAAVMKVKTELGTCTYNFTTVN